VKLVLADGTEHEGIAFGGDGAVCGEVVFNTGMAGYVESLTDPSYRGQILVLTYPLVGNYGVPPPRRAESVDAPYESSRIQVQGLVVQCYEDAYSHHRAARSLGEWLRGERVPAVTGVDTRVLTRRLREHGTMKGWLVPRGMSVGSARAQARGIDMQRDVFRLVAPAAPVSYPGPGPRIMLVDVGAKDHIVRSLRDRGASVLRVPWHARLIDQLEGVDGIVIGNGPGDPSDLGDLIIQVRELIEVFRGPMFGICLGNQILALAAGGKTYKLPYGHRGVNQPVHDLLTDRYYITSQNHGYAVDMDSLSDGWEPWFVNVNDGTNEGIRAHSKPFFGVQFHPEARPGPEDTRYLFDEFLRLAVRGFCT
jgi:carbamoyl-phosphate synthase small subunit